MTSRETKLGLIAVAGLVMALPLASGCEHDGSEGGFASEFSNTSTSRLAFIATKESETGQEGIAGHEVRTGTDSADITADGGTASLEAYEKHGVDPQNLTRNHDYDPGEVYGDTGQSAVVRSRPSGLNEENDTFLTFHETHVAGQTEYSTAYTGTRSDPDVVTGLRGQANRSATYTGTGSAYVGQGDFAYNLDGGLQMNARFSGQDPGITGHITDTTVQAASEDNPSGVNQVTFTGKFIDDSPDFTIGDIRLNATRTASSGNPNGEVAAIGDGGGVGSFFGSHAQGTMGAFAGTGQTTNDPEGADHSAVNVIGSFQGKTADNDPAN